MIKKQLQKTEAASMSLEAALTLPLLILVFLQLALSVHAVSAELSAFSALRRLGKESNLILAAQHQISTSEDYEHNLKGKNSDVSEETSVLNSPFATVLKDAGISKLSSGLLSERLNLWFNEIFDNQLNFSLLKDSRIFLQIPQNSRLGRLHLFYKIPGIWEDLSRSQTILINDWRGNKTAEAESAESDADAVPADIWSWDNLSRGKAFQKKYGGNLSTFHPVVARAEDGHVTMIKSINLLAPTYRGGGSLTEAFEEWMDDLTAFNGSAETGPIVKKSLLIVVPENSPFLQLQILESKQRVAGVRGVAIEIVKDGFAEEP